MDSMLWVVVLHQRYHLLRWISWIWQYTLSILTHLIFQVVLLVMHLAAVVSKYVLKLHAVHATKNAKRITLAAMTTVRPARMLLVVKMVLELALAEKRFVPMSRAAHAILPVKKKTTVVLTLMTHACPPQQLNQLKKFLVAQVAKVIVTAD